MGVWGKGTSNAASLRAVDTTNVPALSAQSPKARSAPFATSTARFGPEGGPLAPIKPEISMAELLSRA
jgi:hypothetical protein